MRRASVQVWGELEDHLPPAKRGGGPFEIDFELPVGLRDLVQSTGIPHVEVARAEVDGRPAGWEWRIDDGASIALWSVHPLASPDPDPRFVLDVHLGKLARLLRLFGFDAAHEPAAADAELAHNASARGAALLTRDRGLLMRGAVRRGRWIRATDPEQQAAEVLVAFSLTGSERPFTRCLECNVELEPGTPDASQVPADVLRRHDAFDRCPTCRRYYWPGSHHRRMAETVERILRSAAASG